MIEDIERFGTELQLHTFPDPRIFQQSQIKVVDARPAKEPAHSVSDLPNGFCHEVIWAEIRLPSLIAWIAIYIQRATIVSIDTFGYESPTLMDEGLSQSQ
jgi:hypothetical protein